ncbi:MAG: metal ABC transporter substrate-binding protein [Candidatus Cloacimonetes bacterium]|jgi:zinc transport system substrate-binding protein|nr:metal ABC transporter substrate-binding protein [Candidatus Cloacimonadota bacterium]MDD2505765.1 metal ABC transporter substrate-binding protein [Candidatus Cloacimonadota bacterium]MDD4146907.1 metal ABC transporter substrate-binding protein [Candidatus Cloacimonadota bacterium]MDD4559187.1 metal ABC transporter substrate-binding protein [Candidatus Cloacimonadota bacterium]
MKKAAYFLILLLFILGACKAPIDQKKTETKPLILTSIYPYELLLKQMVGDAVEVRSMIPPNASVHSFSPQPSHLKDLHKAELIVINGMGLEEMMKQSLDKASDKLLDCSLLLSDLIALDSLQQVREQLMHQHNHDGEHHHDHLATDPHLWTSPQMMMKLSTKLKTELCSRFTDFVPLINHNYDEIFRELSAADELIRTERKTYNEPALITYHNSFHYFCRDYDIRYLGWVQSSPGKEPSPRELLELGTKIRNHGVRRIFVEPQQDPKSAEVLAKEYKLQIGTLDPIGSTFEATTITELILKNWDAMKQAF